MQSRAKSCLWPWKLPDLEGEGKSSLSHPLEGSHNQGVSPSFPKMKHTTRTSSKWEDTEGWRKLCMTYCHAIFVFAHRNCFLGGTEE